MDTTNPHKTLELTVLSAEDIRVDGNLNTKNLYVVVRAESINCYTTRTAAERGGDRESYPSWNEKLLVDIPVHARSITLEVKCRTSTGHVKDVGVARIAISDFLGGEVPDHCLQFLSFRLRDWEGRRNGVLNFSVRVVKSPGLKPIPVIKEKMGSCCGFQNTRGNNVAARSSSYGGVAVGIPVNVTWNNCASNNVMHFRK